MWANKIYHGILFDFDGVLANTMEYNFKAWKAATAEFGIKIKREDYFPLEGMPVKDVVINLFKIYGKNISDSEKVSVLKDNYFLKIHQFKLYLGVIPLIDALVKNKIPFGIVTAGQKNRILKTVPGTFLGKFNTLVTGDMTPQGKPFPDPYLIGSDALGVAPEQCIVVENAPLGIQAAKAANTYCIAICSTLESSYLHEADVVVDSFDQLRDFEVIENLIGGSLN